LYKSHHNIIEAIVITPVTISDDVRAQLISKLSSQLNATIELIEKIDPSLVGGIVVKVGDQLIDTSISGKIKRLEQEFSTNIYSKAY
jgi:F-type H+-transporting ATPase subunit delta